MILVVRPPRCSSLRSSRARFRRLRRRPGLRLRLLRLPLATSFASQGCFGLGRAYGSATNVRWKRPPCSSTTVKPVAASIARTAPAVGSQNQLP